LDPRTQHPKFLTGREIGAPIFQNGLNPLNCGKSLADDFAKVQKRLFPIRQD
jgi:hypothetical protein